MSPELGNLFFEHSLCNNAEYTTGWLSFLNRSISFVNFIISSLIFEGGGTLKADPVIKTLTFRYWPALFSSIFLQNNLCNLMISFSFIVLFFDSCKI